MPVTPPSADVGVVPVLKRPRGTAGLASWSADREPPMTALVQDYTLQRVESLEAALRDSRACEAALRQEFESLERRMQAREALHNLDMQTMQMMSSRLRALETRATLIEVRLPAPPSPAAGHGPPPVSDDDAPLRARVPLTNEELSDLLDETEEDEDEAVPPPADAWGYNADDL